MATESGYGIREPRVVYEAFEEEVVVLDLESGSYYSMRASAAWIFLAAVGGASVAAMAAAFAPGDEPADVGAAVGEFLDSLVAEGLLVPQRETAAAPDRVALPGSAGPFAPPQFEKFTDMKDLLLLDPIHDVVEMGWPRAAEKSGRAQK